MYLSQIVKSINKFRNISKLYNVSQCSRTAFARFSTKTIDRKVTNKDDSDEIDLNAPVKFSASPANQWQARYTRLGTSKEPRLWYEPIVILVSLTVFMIYFAILREENDVDQELTKSLYERIEGLEEHQLRLSLKYNLDNGLSTDAIVKRLTEIEQAKSKSNAEQASA